MKHNNHHQSMWILKKTRVGAGMLESILFMISIFHDILIITYYMNNMYIYINVYEYLGITRSLFVPNLLLLHTDSRALGRRSLWTSAESPRFARGYGPWDEISCYTLW